MIEKNEQKAIKNKEKFLKQSHSKGLGISFIKKKRNIALANSLKATNSQKNQDDGRTMINLKDILE